MTINAMEVINKMELEKGHKIDSEVEDILFDLEREKADFETVEICEPVSYEELSLYEQKKFKDCEDEFFVKFVGEVFPIDQFIVTGAKSYDGLFHQPVDVAIIHLDFSDEVLMFLLE